MQIGKVGLWQSELATHCTQVWVFTSQTGSAADLQSLLAKQSPLPLQVLFVQVKPVPQSRLAMQATQLPVSGLQTGVAASLVQSLLEVQLPGAPATQQLEAQC